MELCGGGGRCVIQCRQMDNIDLAEYECEYECGRFDFEFYRQQQQQQQPDMNFALDHIMSSVSVVVAVQSKSSCNSR